MQLFGIKIRPPKSPITKLLTKGWYPFGNFSAPNKYGFVSRKYAVPGQISSIYSDDSIPLISVSAVVGKNGSGKSSLIDLLLRIINNFTKVYLGKSKSENNNRHLFYAYGIHADLHFETFGQQYKIVCDDTKVALFEVFHNYPESRVSQYPPEEINAVFARLFYTVVTNYSLYAYNPEEYGFEKEIVKDKSMKGGEWLNGLFHKNDGYYTPIVITPYRHEGMINLKNEARLSMQRIIKLALLADIQGSTLLPNYKPLKLLVSFNDSYQGSKDKDITEYLSKINQDAALQAKEFIRVFSNEWKSALNLPYKSHEKTTADRIINTAVYYLAYKTLKLFLTYPDYRKKFSLSKSTPIREFIIYQLENTAKKAIKSITDEFDRKGVQNHLTLKIKQTYYFIKEYQSNKKFPWKKQEERNVKNILSNVDVCSYGDLFSILPPPFYNLDLRFERVDKNLDDHHILFKNDSKDMTISMMSSGERQMLNALSYVLYHLKNLESVIPDKERVKYRHVCLIFDEIELYFHPEYQRTFVARLIEAIKWCGVKKENIESIQILLLTHSPFILSDIFTHNTLYLDEMGEPTTVKGETFGANYYSMLANSFFFNDSAVGKYSTRFISDLISKASNKNSLNKEDILSLSRFVGDDFVRNYINNIDKFER